MTQEVIDEPGTTNDQTIAYTYDAVGNRTLMNRSSVGTSYGYDANDRLLAETSGTRTLTSTYDSNGNLKTRSNGTSADSYTYDAENRLISAVVQTGGNPATVTYTYDDDGLRIGKTAGGVTTTFLLDKTRNYTQAMIEKTGNAIINYNYGHGLISQTATGTGSRFYLADGDFSTRQLTTSAGSVSDTYTYDGFGGLLSSSETTPNNYRYRSEQFDPTLGVYYLRARYYDQTTGRFISADPVDGVDFRSHLVTPLHLCDERSD